MKRIFLVAGEASGDLHGSLLATALRTLEPTVELIGVGGSEMEAAGVRLVHRCEQMGVTGLWEVFAHLPRLARLLGRLDRHLRAERPDALVLIDYPDFNLRLAARAKRINLPVIYFISPQVWAWRKGRIAQLARTIRRMIVIFPFEVDLYQRASIPVTYVGHPLVDRIAPTRPPEETRRRLGIEEDSRMIALLPGSRDSEIRRILPPLFDAVDRLKARRDLRWFVAAAPGLEIDRIARTFSSPAVQWRCGETYDLLAAADLAVVASGTATLEAAVLGTPMIVVYRMHPLTWQLARRLVRVDHVAMANILAGERLVPELLQGEVEGKRLAAEIVQWIEDPALRTKTGQKLRQAASSLGEGGAARRAAETILKELEVK